MTDPSKIQNQGLGTLKSKFGDKITNRRKNAMTDETQAAQVKAPPTKLYAAMAKARSQMKAPKLDGTNPTASTFGKRR